MTNSLTKVAQKFANFWVILKTYLFLVKTNVSTFCSSLGNFSLLPMQFEKLVVASAKMKWRILK